MFLVTLSLIYILQSVPIEAARDGDVRLVDSNRYGAGRVEVFYEGSWGTICHRGWDLNDAEVVCRQLDFPNGALRSFYGARFGQGSGRVLLSDVNCVGDENNLLECNNVQNTWAMNDCEHGSDVGVQCSAPNYEGCFQISLLRTIVGIRINEMTLEKCFTFCAPEGYQYILIQQGDTCDCSNVIEETAQVNNERCSIECPGNSDQHCGGRDLASVYKVEFDLPFVASPGFPGRFTSTSGPLTTTRNFDPQGTTGYSFIRFHQFDLPPTGNLSVSSNGDTDLIRGGTGINEYWIASTNSPIQISFQLPQENIDSMGFLVEFGEGTYCPTVTSVSNGGISTTASVPYTVGIQLNVVCNSGYIAYDDTVFCQADRTFNRNIMCVAGGPTTAPSTQQAPVTQQQPQSTGQPQPTQTTQQSQSMRTNAPSVPSSPGTTMESQITNQRTTPYKNPLTRKGTELHILLTAVSVVFLVTVVFILACLVRERKGRSLSSKRQMEGLSRNEGVTSPTSVSLQHEAGYETPSTVTSGGYDRHIIDTAKTTSSGSYDRHIVDTDKTAKLDGYDGHFIDTAKTATSASYERPNVNTINQREEHNRYYNIKSDSSSHMDVDYDLKLDQNYPYEDVRV